MENQPIEQTDAQPIEQTTEQAVGQEVVQSSSSKTMYIIIGAVVVIALVVAYFALKSPTTSEVMTDSQALTEQTVDPALTEGNTTADISADLNQLVGDSAALDADAAASESDIQSL